jgi:hypothetical protein
MRTRLTPPAGHLPGTESPAETPAATAGASPSVVNRAGNPLPPRALYSSPTAHLAKHRFSFKTDSSKTQESGQTRAGTRPLSDPSETHGWPGSNFEHRYVQTDASEPVRFMRRASLNVSTPGNLHNSASVADTAYLRLAAVRLIDRNVDDGRLQAFHLDGMIDKFSNDSFWNGREDQRDDIVRALRTLKNDSELRATFNSIGEGRW